MKDNTGRFIGEITYHCDSGRNFYVADVIIYAPHRGKGYGGIGLDLLCSAAKQNGVKILYDDIAIDNPGITMFLNRGFVEEYRTDEIIILKKRTIKTYEGRCSLNLKTLVPILGPTLERDYWGNHRG